MVDTFPFWDFALARECVFGGLSPYNHLNEIRFPISVLVGKGPIHDDLPGKEGKYHLSLNTE